MNQAEIQTKLDGMKKTRKALSIVTMVTAIVCMAVLLAYNFMSVTYLKSPMGTDYEQGFASPGWADDLLRLRPSVHHAGPPV